MVDLECLVSSGGGGWQQATGVIGESDASMPASTATLICGFDIEIAALGKAPGKTPGLFGIL